MFHHPSSRWGGRNKKQRKLFTIKSSIGDDFNYALFARRSKRMFSSFEDSQRTAPSASINALDFSNANSHLRRPTKHSARALHITITIFLMKQINQTTSVENK